jgi:hypothetical protein
MAGAVSGNGVQNPTYAPDPAFLAGIVDTGFESGDRAYVNSLRPNGRFYLDRESVAAPDNVTVIMTFSGFGRWLVETGGGGGGAPLITENQPVTFNGQTVFALGALPAGAVIMFVNGVQYEQGVHYTVLGVMVTWLNPPAFAGAPFPLNTAMLITFAYN